MATIQPTQFDSTHSGRLVWILNRDIKRDYKESFRDEAITIPANQKKIPKHVRDGGNLMEWLPARRFLMQPSSPYEALPNGEVINMGKPLFTEELTDEERAEIQGKSKKDLTKAAKEEEKALQNTCTLCGETMATSRGLNLHIKSKHPERQPLSESVA